MAEQIIILTPVFNDGDSLNSLLDQIAVIAQAQSQFQFSIVVADDGSTEQLIIKKQPALDIYLLRMHRNIGHQKTIAIGLAAIHEQIPYSKVIVMDADGEDAASDMLRLCEHPESSARVIFAQRKKRQEAGSFLFFYAIYKRLFRLLTGKQISFGNFLVISRPLLAKLVHYSEIWNHLAGGIVKSGLPYTTIQTERGKRFFGKSKMSFTSLLLHGLGAIAVFMEVIATRLLLFSLLLILVSFIGILVLIGIKTFTDFAIPGWTSTVASAMLIILLQSFLLSLFTIFLYLSSQSQRKFIPARHYRDYTGELENV